MTIPHHIITILQKYLDDLPLSEQEVRELQQWRASGLADSALLEEEDWQHIMRYSQFQADKEQQDYYLQRFMAAAGIKDQRIPEDLPEYTDATQPLARGLRPSIPFLRKWGWAAAFIILIAGAAVFFAVSSDHQGSGSLRSLVHTKDILPGKEGAILILADGTQVLLDSVGNGVISLQNGSKAVIKNGQLVYDPTGETTGNVVYNTMMTPKGRHHSLLLSDGTRVWLNAASSIRYPTVFSGKERKVEIKGEAYFEVAKNTEMPFRVNVNNQAEVVVLGTHFNINAYEDEGDINTTLLEGSVIVQAGQKDMLLDQKRQSGNKSQLHSVSADRPGVILKPGQQALMLVDQKIRQGTKAQAQPEIHVKDADIDQVMAWKNGLFNFNGLSFQNMARQLERWYDIQVEFQGNIPELTFRGKLNRAVPLSDILDYLRKLNVETRLEGRKLIMRGMK